MGIEELLRKYGWKMKIQRGSKTDRVIFWRGKGKRREVLVLYLKCRFEQVPLEEWEALLSRPALPGQYVLDKYL